MKKNIASFFVMWRIFMLAFGQEDVYTELLNKLNRENKSVSLMHYENKIINRTILNEKLKWLPKLSMENSASIQGFIKDKSKNAFEVNSNFVLTQKLLLGSNLQIYANNTMRILKENSLKFNYGFMAGASLNIPMYVFTPMLFVSAVRSDFYSQKNETQMLLLKKKLISNAEVSKALNYLGEYYLQQKRINLLDEKLLLLKIMHDKKIVLWQEGKISTAELNENLASYEQAKINTESIRINFEALGLKLMHCGLTIKDIPQNFEEWITKWEQLVEKISLENIDALDLKKLQLNSNWQKQVQHYMQSVSNLFVACNFQNVQPSSDAYNTNFLNSITGTFKNNSDFKWTVNIGMNINFDPFSEKAQLNQNFSDMKMIHKMQQSMLDDEYLEQLTDAKNTVLMLQKIVQQKYETEKILQTRFEQATALHTAGKISKHDHNMQKIYLQESALELLRSRLNRVCYLLSFYSPKTFF